STPFTQYTCGTVVVVVGFGLVVVVGFGLVMVVGFTVVVVGFTVVPVGPTVVGMARTVVVVGFTVVVGGAAVGAGPPSGAAGALHGPGTPFTSTRTRYALRPGSGLRSKRCDRRSGESTVIQREKCEVSGPRSISST